MKKLFLLAALAAAFLPAQQQPRQQKSFTIEEQLQRLYNFYDRSVEARNAAQLFEALAAPDYAAIDADGNREDARQAFADLNRTLQGLPENTQIHVSTTIRNFSVNAEGSLNVRGKTHAEIIFDKIDGSICNVVEDRTFVDTWLRTPRGLRLAVKHILTSKQTRSSNPAATHG